MTRLWRALMLVALAAACSRAPEAKQYQLQGQILAIKPERQEVLIKHDDIKGFMPGMTMPFKVKDAELLRGKRPGDLVTATLVVADVDAHLSSLATTGHAPLEETPPATTSVELLNEGDVVPDQLLVDQDGKPKPPSAFRGHRVVLTFTYTRCPMPNFCPLMDRHFAAIQRQVKADPALADVRLLSVSFDPEFDTPSVLKRHAQKVEADPLVWTFATGEHDEVTAFAGRFGVMVERPAENPVDITHNLRTAVIDPQGRVVKMHSGNEWTPADVLAELRTIDAAGH